MFHYISHLRYYCLLLCSPTNLDIRFPWQHSTATPVHSFTMVVSTICTILESDEFENVQIISKQILKSNYQ